MNDKTLELFDAAYAGDIEKVKVCIDRGGDVNAINSCGDTPLIEAIASDNAKNRVAIVKLLIEHGADPDFKGEENCGDFFIIHSGVASVQSNTCLELVLR